MMAAGKKEPEEKKTDSQGIKRTLRDGAEEQLARSPKRSPELKGQTPEQLILELEVHQIELETQAEELRRAHIALGESRDKFLDLYDFAPIGYLSLNDKALITGVNLSGTTLLGVERKDLVGAPFSKFMPEKGADQWYLYFMNVLKQDGKRSCTLMLNRSDDTTFPARLESLRLAGSDGAITVRIAFSDITDIWQIEALRASEIPPQAMCVGDVIAHGVLPIRIHLSGARSARVFAGAGREDRGRRRVRWSRATIPSDPETSPSRGRGPSPSAHCPARRAASRGRVGLPR
jgi:PAS domain S-box-containing protein